MGEAVDRPGESDRLARARRIAERKLGLSGRRVEEVKASVLEYLVERGAAGFNELRRVTNANPKYLAEALRELVESGYVERRKSPRHRQGVEYFIVASFERRAAELMFKILEELEALKAKIEEVGQKMEEREELEWLKLGLVFTTTLPSVLAVYCLAAYKLGLRSLAYRAAYLVVDIYMKWLPQLAQRLRPEEVAAGARKVAELLEAPAEEPAALIMRETMGFLQLPEYLRNMADSLESGGRGPSTLSCLTP